MFAQKKLVLFYLFIVFFTTTNIFAGTVSDVTEGLTAVTKAFDAGSEAVGAGSTFFETAAAAYARVKECFTGEQLAEVEALLVAAQAKNTMLIQQGVEAAQTIGGLKGVVSELQNQAGADATELARKAALITKLKWVIGVGISAVVVGGVVWYFYNKNQQEKKLTEQEKKIKLSEVKSAFYECLACNKKSAKDSDGMPVACKGLIREFIEIAGQEKYDSVKKAFLAQNGA